MKSLSIALCFCLLAFCGRAMIHANRPAPVLHSVFDAAPPAPLPTFQERWLMTDPEAGAPFGGPRHFDPGKAARRREAGIYMLVIGTAVAALGAGIIINAPAYDPATGGHMDSYSRGMT
jgi:hypothetical protein